MKLVESVGVNYEVRGEREAEAAAVLEEGLAAVGKRRSAYVDGNLEVILTDISKDFAVEIRAVPQ